MMPQAAPEPRSFGTPGVGGSQRLRDGPGPTSSSPTAERTRGGARGCAAHL